MLSNAVQSSSSGTIRKYRRLVFESPDVLPLASWSGLPWTFFARAELLPSRFACRLAVQQSARCIRQSACPIVEMSVSERSVGVCILISIAAFVLNSQHVHTALKRGCHQLHMIHCTSALTSPPLLHPSNALLSDCPRTQQRLPVRARECCHCT